MANLRHHHQLIFSSIHGPRLATWSAHAQILMPANRRFSRQGLPTEDQITFPQSSFFRLPSSLPPPGHVRAIYRASGGDESLVTRVLRFPELGLIVKYGINVTKTEGQSLLVINTFLKDAVPTPEIFGWCKDGPEVFLYMQLISGPSLDDMWPTMREDQKLRVCHELNSIFTNLHSLEQDLCDRFVGTLSHTLVTAVDQLPLTASPIGSVAGGPVEDYIFAHRKQPHSHHSVKAFHDWYSKLTAPDPAKAKPHPVRDLLLNDVPVVLTHGDLHRDNVIVSPSDPPK
jgi:Phosphotransferase enzyme family